MQFITTLFGASGGTMLNAAFSLGIVLVLVVLLLWVVKMISGRGQGFGRTRRGRLAVVESAVVDGKRRVLIVRRDNVEHVIMTGGPQDLVIESGIPAPEPQLPVRRPVPARQAVRSSPVAPTTDHQPVATDAVLRDTLDRLDELARPAPLRPRRSETAWRESGPEQPVIPKGPQLRIDNSAEAAVDSANTASDGNSVAHGDTSGRIGRFARRVRRGDA